jgi:glycosyltransferase involved in cell wall biosynthesis
MRVCLIAISVHPVEPRVRRMAESLVRAGHAVDVICLRGAGQAAEEICDGVRVLRLPIKHSQGGRVAAYAREYGGFFAQASATLLRRHRETPYQLVQVSNPPDALAFCALPLKLRGVPVILDLRELTPELFASRFGLPLDSLALRGLRLQERLACAFANGVLVLHERHRKIMLGRGVNREKLTQVMNCPDERVFDPARSPARRAPDGRFVVLHHGGIFHRYGVDLLVEAVAQARTAIPSIELRLFGAGDYEAEVRRLARERGIADIVHFFGQQPLEQMPAAIASADVGVAPMRRDMFTDCGLPTKLLEYVMLGVPAITSRTLSTTDYFDDSMVAFFDSGDAAGLAARLVETYRDPQAARERATRARAFTENNNWRTESDRYIRLVERLAGKRERQTP